MKRREDFKLKVSVDGMKFSTKSHEDSHHITNPDKKMRVYLFPENENVLENFQNRRNRDKSLWRKIALQVMEEYGYKDVKMTYSQRAGCRCGCSPGFVAELKNGRVLYIDYKQVKR